MFNDTPARKLHGSQTMVCEWKVKLKKCIKNSYYNSVKLINKNNDIKPTDVT